MKKIFIIILSAVFALYVLISVLYITLNDIPGLAAEREGLQVKYDNLEMDYYSNAFHYNAAMLEIDNLEKIITSKDTLILELKIKTKVLPLYKEMLAYCVSYIRLCQTMLVFNGIPYPEFIIDSVLTEEFFEDLDSQIGSQIEIFEEVTNDIQ